MGADQSLGLALVFRVEGYDSPFMENQMETGMI